mgnify:CR=1 FL=1
MLQAFLNIWKIRYLRTKILFTLGMLAIYRICFFIPLPGVNQDAIKSWAESAAGGAVGNSVARLGHGMGMQVTEWPTNTADDGTVLVEGMVMTLEPGLTWAPGKMMVHEENLVIRSDGPELLSRRAPPELPILG